MLLKLLVIQLIGEDAFHYFDYYRQKTAEEFKECVMRELTKNYEDNPDVRTKMTVAEIEKEFLTRVLTRQ